MQISYKVGDKVRLIVNNAYFSSHKKFKKGTVGTVVRVFNHNDGFLFCPDGNDPALLHDKNGCFSCYVKWVEPVHEEDVPQKPAAKKLSEILQLAFDSGSYQVGRQDFMCLAIDSMADRELITSEEAKNTKNRIMKQVGTVYKNRYKKGLCDKTEGISLAGAFTKEKDCYKCAEQYFRKWIRDLKRRGN